MQWIIFDGALRAADIVSASARASGMAGANGAALAGTTMWYLTRAAAVSAYALLALTVVLGLLRSLVRSVGVRTGGVIWWLDELHQFSAPLAGAFVVLHLTTLLLDSFLSFSLANLLLPVGEPYRPLATGLGVLALYALAHRAGQLMAAPPLGVWHLARAALHQLHPLRAGDGARSAGRQR